MSYIITMLSLEKIFFSNSINDFIDGIKQKLLDNDTRIIQQVLNISFLSIKSF